MPAPGRINFSSRGMLEALNTIEICSSNMRSVDDCSSLYPPSVESVSITLQDCRKKKNLQHAKTTYAHLCDNGLEGHCALENFLVPMFVECGDMLYAQQVFKKLLHPNEFSYVSLIQGYIGCRDFHGALHAYQILQEDVITPNEFIYIAALKACARLMFMKTGQELHSEIAKEGYESDLYVGSTLVDLYVKCGVLAEAHDVLHELPTRDVVLWTTLISGYTEQGLGEEALECLEEMKSDGVSPDAFAFVCGLKACSSIGALDRGRALYAEISDKDLKKDHVVASAVVDMFAKCGSLVEAREVFDGMSIRDVITWTTLIRGYAEQGLGDEGLHCFERMQQDGVLPDAVTFVCSLKACGCAGAADKGRAINDQIYKCGYQEDTFVGNMLVDMYVKCKLLPEAHHVFQKLERKDVITWNTIMAGYAEQEHGEEALCCLDQMLLDKTSPDEVTFLYILKAYADVGETNRGRDAYGEIVKHRETCQCVHNEIVKYGFECDQFLGNALVSMYAKCDLRMEAEKVFDSFVIKNSISWNALIEGYMELGLAEEVLGSLDQMQLEGVSPDAVTYLCGVKACGILGALTKGKALHAEMADKEKQSSTLSTNAIRVSHEKPGLESGVILSTALIHMYGRCGSMDDAMPVFTVMPKKDLVIWNALLTAYAVQGESDCVFFFFGNMMGDGYAPNEITFLAILMACSHAGLVEESGEYFECMTEEYGITPTVKHHNCMVDILGRSGRLSEAAAVLAEIYVQPDLVLWSTVLGACGKWGNLEVGRHAFEGAVSLNECHSAAFVSLSNIWADRIDNEFGGFEDWVTFGIDDLREFRDWVPNLASRCVH